MSGFATIDIIVFVLIMIIGIGLWVNARGLRTDANISAEQIIGTFFGGTCLIYLKFLLPI